MLGELDRGWDVKEFGVIVCWQLIVLGGLDRGWKKKGVGGNLSLQQIVLRVVE